MIQEQLINYSNVQLNREENISYEASTSQLIAAIFFIYWEGRFWKKHADEKPVCRAAY